MNKALGSVFFVAVFAAAQLRGNENARIEYKAKDGWRVVITTSRKATKGSGQESVVEFYSMQNQMLCSMDFSSSDGEHGFAAEKAAWTPDEQYFVFSLASSGGHQPWHTPIVFYSLSDKGIRSLDSYTEGHGISKGDFELEAPNTVLTTIFREPPMPVRFRLDSLSGSDDKPQHALRCMLGQRFRVDPYDLKDHD